MKRGEAMQKGWAMLETPFVLSVQGDDATQTLHYYAPKVESFRVVEWHGDYHLECGLYDANADRYFEAGII